MTVGRALRVTEEVRPGWTRTTVGGGSRHTKGRSTYVHSSGWRTSHCGHPTATCPYALFHDDYPAPVFSTNGSRVRAEAEEEGDAAMIYGDLLTDDRKVVLNVRWPQRHLYRVTDPDPGPRGDGEALVWADDEEGAIETLAEWNDHEGDDDRVSAVEVEGEERVEIGRFCDRDAQMNGRLGEGR